MIMDVKMKKYWSGRVSELREHITEILGYENRIEWESEGYDSTMEQLKTHLQGERQLTLEEYLGIDGSNKLCEISSKLEALIPDEKPSIELQHELSEYIDVVDSSGKGMFSTGVDEKQYPFSGPCQSTDYWNIPEEAHRRILDICNYMEARGNSRQNFREALVLYYFLIRPTVEEYQHLTDPENRNHLMQLKDTLNRCNKALDDCKKIILVIKDWKVHQALIYRNDQKRGVRMYKTPNADQTEGCNVLLYLRREKYPILCGEIELSTKNPDYQRVAGALKKGLDRPTLKGLRIGNAKNKEKGTRKTANYKLALKLRPLYRFIEDNDLIPYLPTDHPQFKDIFIVMDFFSKYLNIDFSKEHDVVRDEIMCRRTKKMTFRVQ
jgi:hypothetical protein